MMVVLFIAVLGVLGAITGFVAVMLLLEHGGG